ncbi:MAG: cell division protein FtsL [Bacillota bacterium]|nr:cell division protein FtsL [Bacillota bacterium]
MKSVRWNYKYIIIAFLLLYFVWILVSQQVTIRKKEVVISDLKNQISQAEKESKSLKVEIKNAGSKETIEKIAREKLGMVYPDERKYVDSNG